MALPCIWRFWVASILLSGTLSLGCERLVIQNAATLFKLRPMLQRSRLTLDCVTSMRTPQIPPVSLFNLTANLTVEGKRLAIRQTVDQVNQIFSQKLSTAPWNPTQLERFRVRLYEQLEGLNECVGEPASDSGSQKIHQYFRKLREFLELERFSACAWKLVGNRIRSSLQNIPAIAGNM